MSAETVALKNAVLHQPYRAYYFLPMWQCCSMVFAEGLVESWRLAVNASGHLLSQQVIGRTVMPSCRLQVGVKDSAMHEFSGVQHHCAALAPAIC